jgi:hypothetical protein
MKHVKQPSHYCQWLQADGKISVFDSDRIFLFVYISVAHSASNPTAEVPSRQLSQSEHGVLLILPLYTLMGWNLGISTTL